MRLGGAGWSFFFLLLAGCRGEQDFQAVCDPETPNSQAARRACLPCRVDEDCIVSGNTCEPTAFCAHRDYEITSSSLGCNDEYEQPDHDACVCRESFCAVL